MNLSHSRIGKGVRLIIYNKLNNKFLADAIKKEKKTELLEEVSFLEEINNYRFCYDPSSGIY